MALRVATTDSAFTSAYDKGAEEALRTCAERGWNVISMRSDFARVFDRIGDRLESSHYLEHARALAERVLEVPVYPPRRPR